MSVIKAKHGTFKIDPRDRYVAGKLVADGTYSEDELALLGQCVSSDTDALIVGAHIGAFVVPLSRLCRKLVAIEANPATFELLAWNVKENGCANVELHFGAANDTGGGTLDLLCGTVNSGGSKRVPVHAFADYYEDNPQLAQTPTLRLDDVCAGREFELVHMDIEGSEIHAMRGAPKLLASTKYLSLEFISHHLTHVAGVTVEEWLAPIRPHFNTMLLPGCAANQRPHILLEPADWHEMLQNIVDAGVGIENLIFWRK